MKPKTKNQSVIKWLLWPLKIFNTRIRLAFGLAVSVFSLVMVAQVFKILPDSNRPLMDARKLQTETLAITGSAMAETNPNLREFKKTLENTLDRADDLISIGLRRSNGKLDISSSVITLVKEPLIVTN